jgi:bacterioferritin
MKGSQKVIEALKNLLAGELAARDQYFIHSRMYEDWGLNKLYERLNHEMEDETGHADQMIKRILFLEGIPDLNHQEQMNVGSTVPEMLQCDLDWEYKTASRLRAAIAECEQESDYVTRDMLAKQLDDTENDHAHWLEQQLGLINKIGLQNYQQSQI